MREIGRPGDIVKHILTKDELMILDRDTVKEKPFRVYHVRDKYMKLFWVWEFEIEMIEKREGLERNE